MSYTGRAYERERPFYGFTIDIYIKSQEGIEVGLIGANGETRQDALILLEKRVADFEAKAAACRATLESLYREDAT